MLLHIAVLSAFLMGASSAAFAQSGSSDQQSACRPDVRRFCYKLKDADDNAFLKCLQEHRAKLSVPCRTMLESHGV